MFLISTGVGQEISYIRFPILHIDGCVYSSGKRTALDVHKSKNGRLIVINLEINGNIFSIINVYCPKTFNSLFNFLGEIGEQYAM